MSSNKNKPTTPSTGRNSVPAQDGFRRDIGDSTDFGESRSGVNNVKNSMPAPRNPNRDKGSQGDNNQG